MLQILVACLVFSRTNKIITFTGATYRQHGQITPHHCRHGLGGNANFCHLLPLLQDVYNVVENKYGCGQEILPCWEAPNPSYLALITKTLNSQLDDFQIMIYILVLLL